MCVPNNSGNGNSSNNGNNSQNQSEQSMMKRQTHVNENFKYEEEQRKSVSSSNEENLQNQINTDISTNKSQNILSTGFSKLDDIKSQPSSVTIRRLKRREGLESIESLPLGSQISVQQEFVGLDSKKTCLDLLGDALTQQEVSRDEILQGYIDLYRQECSKPQINKENIEAFYLVLHDYLLKQMESAEEGSDQKTIIENILNVTYALDTIIKEEDTNVLAEANPLLDMTAEDVKKIGEIQDKTKAFERRLAANEFLSLYDRQTRLLNYYKLFENSFSNLKGKRLDAPTRIRLLKIEKEKEVLEYVVQNKREAIKRKEAEVNRKRGLFEEADEENKEELRNEYQTALEQYKALTTNQNKKDLLAMDDAEISRQKWEADKSLNKVQINRISEIDSYLFDNSVHDEEDKMLVESIMGLTVRQRMAMYACLENGVDKMDYGSLVFSQANYLPDLNKIKSQMKPWYRLRKRGRWDKVRRAYEYITNNKDAFDNLVDIAIEQQPEEIRQDSENLDSKQMTRINAKESRIGLNDGPGLDGQLNVKLNVKANDIFLLLKSIKEANNEQQIESLSNELREAIKGFRTLVDKKINLDEKNPMSTALADGIKSLDEVVSKWIGEPKKYINAANSVTKLVLPKYGDSGAATVFDYKDVAFNFIDPTTEIISSVSNICEVSRKIDQLSASAKTKGTIKILGNISNLSLHAYNFASMQSEYNSILKDGVTGMREDVAKGVKERVSQGQGAFKFDMSDYLVINQVINTGLTVGTAAVDIANVISSNRSRKILTKNLKMIRRGDEVTDEYRKARHKLTLSTLVKKINQRTKISTASSIVCDGIGYVKYFAPYTGIGAAISGASFAVKTIAKIATRIHRWAQDKTIVDKFLDIDTMLQKHKRRENIDHFEDEKLVRKRFRKKALLELGFANSKTFFAHVALKLGKMMHDLIENGNKTERESCMDILRSFGLKVSQNKIPDPKLIASVLSK